MGQSKPAAVNEPEVKPDWKDFIALTIATYQILFVPLLAIVGGVVVSFLLLGLLFR
jgi:nitrate reductase NapE component